MKKKVKWIAGIAVIAALLAGAGIYMTKPTEVVTVAVTEGAMTESLRLEGTVAANDTNVVVASTNGFVTDILYRTGESVEAGAEMVLVDDTEYQREIADEITLLQKEKVTLYNRNCQNGLEVRMRQQQLIDAINVLQHEYVMMFDENGTAYNNEDAAKWALHTAKASYEAAVQTNDDWKDQKKKHPDMEFGSAPFSGAQLNAYAGAVAEAEAAYENAKQLSSEKNRLYYENLLAIYLEEFDTLTEMGNYNAESYGQEASKLQVSINALARKQTTDKMAAGISGIVSELLVEKGSYVTKNQPLVRIYDTGNKRLEVWMLTEDAADHQPGDPVRVELPDGKVLEERITFISPVAEERVSTLGVKENRCRVEVTAKGLSERMGPGYEVTLQFERELEEAGRMLPVSALFSEDQNTFVYVVEDGACRKVPVETGTYSGGMVKITGELKTGAEVVENPEAYQLKDGGKVVVK